MNWKRYTKAIVAAVTAGLLAAAEALPEYSTEIQAVVAVLGVVAVYFFPNEE